MSKIFNHTVQKIGSTTSPVEDLALEVADAFALLEDKLSTNPNIIPTFKEVIGDLTLESLRQHKVSKTETEIHNILPNENSIVLENIPTEGTVAISYFNNATQSTVTLTKVDSQTDFSDKNQYKVNGKVILLNISVPGLGSVPVTVTYSTTTFPFGGKKLLPNVLKDVNGHWTLEPKHLADNKYTIDFGKNIADNLDEYKKDTNAKFKFYVSQNKSEWQELEVENYDVTGSIITIETDDLNLVSGQTSVATFVSNTTISELLNSLYEEFVKHDHSSEGLTKNIAVQDIINRYSNGKISYKSGNIVNYSFPQYLNREGHNPNLDAVYENSLLGNLFVSRKLNSEGTKYKGLDEDSNAIIFGDPSLGHRIRYDRSLEVLTLNSVESLNGLKIVNTHPNKYTLALNSTELTSTRDKLIVKPEGGLIDVSSLDSNTKYGIKTDNLEVTTTSTFRDAVFKSFRLNNVKFLTNDNTVDAKIIPVTNTAGDIPKLEIKVVTEIDDLTVKDLKMTDAKFKGFSLGKVIGKEQDDGSFVFESDKLLKFKNPVHTDDLAADRIKVGDVLLSKNDQDPNNGLVVLSTKPDSDIQFKTDISFINTKTVKATSNQSIIDSLDIGDIRLSKDVDKNLHITSTNVGKKVVVESPVEFLNITSGLNSNVALTTINSDTLTIGNHQITKRDDDTVIKPTDVDNSDSVLILESKTHLKNVEIDGGQINSVKLGTSTLTVKDADAHIKPNNQDTSKLYVDTEAHVRKLLSDRAEVVNLQSLDTTMDKLHIGDITIAKNLLNNVEIVGKEPTDHLIVKTPITLENATIKELRVTEELVQKTITENISLGNIELIKDPDSNDMQVIRKDQTSKAMFVTPTHFNEVVIEDLTTTRRTRLSGLEIDTLDLHGFVFKKNQDDDNLSINNEDDTKTLEINSSTKVSKLHSDELSATNFKLSNRDKILIDDDNYISNYDGKFNAHVSKGFTFTPSGQSSGLVFNLKEDTTPVVNQYIAANSGAPGVESEKNLFIETNVSSGTYFLKPTHTRVTKNNTVMGFNDPTAQLNITDLTKWFRSDLFAGKISGDTLVASVNEDGSKKGLKIGSTRLSVIGPGTNCPEGLTTLESIDSVHIIQPTGDTDACRNLTYQKVSTGSLSVFGDITAEGSGTFTEDLLVNSTIASKDLAVTGDAEINNLTVPETLSVAGKASFGSAVEFKNDLRLSNDLISEARVLARSLEIEKNSQFKENLEILGKLDVDKNIAIGGNLVAKGSISTDSVLRSNGLQTLDVRAQDIVSTGSTKVSGDLDVGASASFQNNVTINGGLEVNSKVEIKNDLIAEQFYTINTADIRGKLTAMAGFEAKGKNIQIGSEESLIQMTGKLQFDTKEVSYNSPVKMYNTLKVSDDTEILGDLSVRGDITSKSALNVEGTFTASSSAVFRGEFNARNIALQGNLKADGAIQSDSLTTKSIAVDNIATISHLSVTKSLSMAMDTEIVGGKSKFSQIVTINPDVDNNIAGNLVVAGKSTFYNKADFSQEAIFGSGSLIVDGNGVTGNDATIKVGTIKSGELVGTQKINIPPHFITATNRTIQQLSASIPGRDFVQIDNFVSDGIAVFNQPLMADTIIFKTLEFVGDTADTKTGQLGLDITARRAVYA